MENAGITDEFCRFEPRLTDFNYFISSMYVYFYSQTFTKIVMMHGTVYTLNCFKLSRLF